MISPACFSGGGLIARTCGLRAGLADLVGLDADVAGGLGVERLLLRAHDRLQRRVARLVDRVADRDHGREVDLDRVVAVLGLALARELAVGDVHLDHLGERRHLQVVGDDGADRVALAVVRLLAQQDQVGLTPTRAASRGRSRLRRRRSPRARRRSDGPSGRRRARRPCGARGRRSPGPSSPRRSRRPRRCRLRGSAWRPRCRECRRGSGSSRRSGPDASCSASIRFWTAASGTSLTRQQIFKSEPPWEMARLWGKVGSARARILLTTQAIDWSVNYAQVGTRVRVDPARIAR